MSVLSAVISCSSTKAAHPLEQANLIEMLYREAVKPIYLKLFYSFIELWWIWGYVPLLKNIMLLILVFLKTCQFAPQEKRAVGMNNLIKSSLCNLCLLVSHSSFLEKLVKKPSGFKILLIYCMPVRLLFTFCPHVSEWNQWCQIPLCSQLYSLKIFHFCNTADVATHLVMFCANNVSVYTVCITVTFWAAVFPEAEAEGSPATVQSLAGLAGLGCLRKCRWQGSGSCSGWPGSCRLRLVKFNTGDCSSGWLEKPDAVMSLLFPLQLSILTDVSGKSSREKHATKGLPQLLLSSKVNIK